MNADQKKGWVVFILIIIMAGSLGYNGIYKYNLQQIASFKLQIEEEQKKNEIFQTIAALDKKLQAYKQKSLANTEITQLLDRVLKLAKELNIAIESFNPLPTVYNERYIELPVEIPLKCSYHQLGQFLSLLENNPEFIWVKEINMQKPTVTDPKQTRPAETKLVISGLYVKR